MGQDSKSDPGGIARRLASKEVPKMESLTKDMIYKVREEDEGNWTGKGRRRGEPDLLKWQGDVDYISGLYSEYLSGK